MCHSNERVKLRLDREHNYLGASSGSAWASWSHQLVGLGHAASTTRRVSTIFSTQDASLGTITKYNCNTRNIFAIAVVLHLC